MGLRYPRSVAAIRFRWRGNRSGNLGAAPQTRGSDAAHCLTKARGGSDRNWPQQAGYPVGLPGSPWTLKVRGAADQEVISMAVMVSIYVKVDVAEILKWIAVIIYFLA